MIKARPLVMLAVLAACSKRPPPPVVVVAVDAGAPSVAPAKLDDLLHYTDAHLAVSSKVDNPRDLAEHIADGRLDTAWNGKSGDLVGAWFGFRVPRATRVRIVELTVGYDSSSKKGEDLFAANHRIAKVRVTRDGVSLGEHALDPDRRGFQRIALDAPGGDFKIEVLAVKPGTRAAWKEIVVSELRVLGDTGAARRATPAVPLVGIGAFDARTPFAGSADAGARPKPTSSKTARSVEDLCAAWSAATKDTREKVDDPTDSPCSNITSVTKTCTGTELAAEDGVRIFSFDTSAWGERSSLAIGYAGRVEELPVTLSQRSFCDLGCGGQDLGGGFHSLRVDFVSLREPKKAVITYVTWVARLFPEMIDFPDGGSGPAPNAETSYTRTELTCELGTTLDCKETGGDTKAVPAHGKSPDPYAAWPLP